MAISSKLTSRPRSCEFALLNFRFARHLHTMRSSQGIERIFAETPELNFAFEGRANVWRQAQSPSPEVAKPTTPREKLCNCINVFS
jgi:hypothetical protein